MNFLSDYFGKKRLSEYQRRRWYRIEAANERNLHWAEMDREHREWREKLELAVSNQWPLLRSHWAEATSILHRTREQYPFAQGMKALIKARYEISAGLLGKESGWDIDSVPVADFGNINAAGALTVRTGFSAFPNFNAAPTLVSSPDPEPYQLSTLAALNASRAAGTSTNPLAALVGVYLTHANIAAPPTAFASAAGSVNVKVLSTVSGTATTTTAAPPTLATFSLSGATNLLDVLTITAPTERQLATPTGTLLTTVSGIFNGDCHFAELVASGALNLQGVLAYAELECL